MSVESPDFELNLGILVFLLPSLCSAEPPLSLSLSLSLFLCPQSLDIHGLRLSSQ